MTDETPDGRPFAWYRTYIGEPDREIDVYLGFALFFGAIALAVAAFAVGTVGQAVTDGGFLPRKIAFAFGLVSLPTVLCGIIVLLPVDRRGRYGGAAGAAVCLAGVGLFAYAYPYQWAAGPGPQYSVPVLFVYGLGMAALVASTGGALVAYHIDRARPSPSDFELEADDADGEYSDAEIQRDIEDAMEAVELTWGGVERSDNSTLQIQETADIDASGMQVEAERTRSTGVDEQVAGLKTMKGGNAETARSTTTVDDQTAQLTELRQRRREDEGSDETTVLGRAFDRVAAIVGR